MNEEEAMYGAEDDSKLDEPSEKEETPQIEEEEVEMKGEYENNRHIWNAKVARYLAYAIDGGILCSQFTLQTFIKMLDKVNDPMGNDTAELNREIRYLLHIREKG